MTKLTITLLTIISFNVLSVNGQNALPHIENLNYILDEEMGSLTITFDATDTDNSEVFIALQVRPGMREQIYFPENISGDVGSQTVGQGKEIIWNYKEDFENIEGFFVKIMINDGEAVDINEIVDQVSKSNLESWLNFMAKPRSIKFAPRHLDAVRDSIYEYFQEYELATSKLPFKMIAVDVANVLGEKTGHVSPEKIYVVDAHFDGKDNSPGSDDNASGTAGVLEAARILSQYSFKNSICFIGFDQEENTLAGSRNFVYGGGRKPWEEYLGVLNLEMIGYYSEEENSQEVPTGFDIVFPELYQEQLENGFKGDFILAAANDFSVPLKESYIAALTEFAPELKSLGLDLPNGLGAFLIDFLRSDHANFWAADIPALLITDGSEFRNEHYHTLNDVVETIDFNFMTNVVKGTVGALAKLAEPIHGTEKNFIVEKQIVSSVNDLEQKCQFNHSFDINSGLLILNMLDCTNKINLKAVSVYNMAGQQLGKIAYNLPSQLSFNLKETGVFIVVMETERQIFRQKITLY